jgi:NADP-dependent 3-hydroxy acid dehydrogenase YdfG
MQKRLHLLVALLAFMVTTAMAQITTSSVSGKITANGEDVIGATIKAVHQPSGTVYRAVTTEVRFPKTGVSRPVTVEMASSLPELSLSELLARLMTIASF